MRQDCKSIKTLNANQYKCCEMLASNWIHERKFHQETTKKEHFAVIIVKQPTYEKHVKKKKTAKKISEDQLTRDNVQKCTYSIASNFRKLNNFLRKENTV